MPKPTTPAASMAQTWADGSKSAVISDIDAVKMQNAERAKAQKEKHNKKDTPDK